MIKNHLYYICKVACNSISNAMTIAFPCLSIVQCIGYWNTILASCYLLYAAAFLLTPCEKQTMNELRKRYIPRYKRWNRLRWVTNSLFQIGKSIGASVESYINSNNANFKNRRKHKSRIAIARKHCIP